MSAISLIQPDRDLFSWPQYWAACFGPAPFLPMSREEMDQLGWDSCDIILVTGDAYVDHPSFGMAICGRMLEAQGFRVGIIAQPDWNSKEDFMRLGKGGRFTGFHAVRFAPFTGGAFFCHNAGGGLRGSAGTT